MNTKLSLSLLLPCALTACGFGDTSDGNPAAGIPNISLTNSQLGKSGGFVDINGDTKPDLIVGAPEAKASSGKEGVMLVYLKGADGFAETASTVLKGEANGDFFGFSYANLGDVNGDGKSDFAVGAINAEGDAGISGAAYVYQGGTNPPVLLAKLNGEQTFDKFGFAITGGDLNADGKNDIIVSAPYTFTEDPTHINDGYQSGKVYIYFGGKTISTVPDVVISGEKVNANIGFAIAADDINGDGNSDLLFSASSSAYVYFGGSDFKSRIASSVVPSVNFGDGKGGSGFGRAIAVIGDVNGDGIKDVAISSPNRSVPSTYDNTGSVYVFKGSTGITGKILENDTNYLLAKIIGGGPGDRFGSAIAPAGDTDGDGKADFLVGARWADSGMNPPRKITGNIYLFHGAELSPAMTIADAHIDLRQEEFSSEYGSTIAVDGDMVFGGMPAAYKHSGGIQLSDARHGTAVGGSQGGSVMPPPGGGGSGGGGGGTPHH